MKRIDILSTNLKEFKINPTKEINQILEANSSSPLNTPVFANELFRRPEINFNHIALITNIQEGRIYL